MSAKDLPTNMFEPDSAWKQSFRRKSLAWFRNHARDLPWRQTSDPYATWVSEIMLQQTQVVTVVPYFQRFIKEFPTVQKLASAKEQRVLRLWEGLGYYRRARQMHKAAKAIVKDHAGLFPQDLEAVRALPGIGRYTAGAIVSIAFDARAPILEANTIRLLSRLSAYEEDPLQSEGRQFLWRLAEVLLPRKNVGSFNQALMELGSEVCTPRNPDCDRCPVQSLCLAKLQDLQNDIPRPKQKTNYEDVHEAAVIVRRNGKLLLRQCANDERWAGMWDFPRFAIQARKPREVEDELAETIKRFSGLTIQLGKPWATIKHGVTRFRITLTCYQSDQVSGRLRTNGHAMKWVTKEELTDFPLSATGRKISQMLAGNIP